VSGRFEVHALPLDGLKVLRRLPLVDARGQLERMFCAHDLRTLIPRHSIMQINQTRTLLRGTVRGLHFQRPPYAEMKFVSCVRGEVWDVAVDLRRGSPTLLHWHAETLTPDNHRTMVIPEGFAHGFQTMTDDCELLYFHTALHVPEAEAGVNAEDPGLNIRWPLPVANRSERDLALPALPADFAGFAP